MSSKLGDSDSGAVKFHRVLAEELRYVQDRREHQDLGQAQPSIILFERDVWAKALQEAQPQLESEAMMTCLLAAHTHWRQHLAASQDDEAKKAADAEWQSSLEHEVALALEEAKNKALQAAKEKAVGKKKEALGRDLTPHEQTAVEREAEQEATPNLQKVGNNILKGAWARGLGEAIDEAMRAAEEAQQPLDWKKALEETEAKVLNAAEDKTLREVRKDAWDAGLVGLAFSGGGIRSATFNLGVLQGLADARRKPGPRKEEKPVELLGLFDYLSTVSGGGYIGSWLAAWMKREGDPANVAKQLKPNRVEQAKAKRQIAGQPLPGDTRDEEPEPIHHLRSYSNYLSPKVGLFSADTWTLFSIYCRNLLINHLSILPAAAVCLLVLRLFVPFYGGGLGECLTKWRDGLTVCLGLCVFIPLFVMGFIEQFKARMLESSSPVPRSSSLVPNGRVAQFLRWWLLDSSVAKRWVLHGFVLLPLLAAAILGCWLLSPPPGGTGELRLPKPPGEWPDWLRAILCWDRECVKDWQAWPFVLVFALLNGLANLFAHVCLWLALAAVNRPKLREQDRGIKRALKFVLASLFAGAVGGFLVFVVVRQILVPAQDQGQPFVVAVWGPPLALFILVASIASYVGCLGKTMTEVERELWATIGAWVLIYGCSWLAVTGIALYGGWAVVWLANRQETRQVVLAVLTSSWVLTTVGGALAGWSSQTRTGRGNRWLELLGRVAPAVFLVGALIALSLLINLLVGPGLADGDETKTLLWKRYWQPVISPDWRWFLWVFGACVAVVCIMEYLVDANLFSLHATYANRLVRCYLGASRPKASWADRLGKGGAPTNVAGAVRQEHLITGFDPEDDMPLQDLAIGKPPSKPSQGAIYWGPYPLFNTALNLATGDMLAWQERKADSFVLAPVYCGSKSTGYRKLPPENDSLTVGRAVAISGAAVSPNMGYHSSPALAALMTVFNVRLGWWLKNPRKRADWNTDGPGAFLRLGQEMFSATNDKSVYVYLSDGGHFENLGVYELVRRRCRYILACDAGQDTDYKFQDLANLVRRVRNDFGIRIDIDVSPLRQQGPDRRSLWHCAVGKIHYGDVDGHARGKAEEYGILVYLKASLTGNEPNDVLHYAARYASFPHQTTADQFFTESQFESYRALGYHVAREVLDEGLADVKEDPTPANRATLAGALFQALENRWRPSPAGFQENFLESTKPYLDLQEALRKEESLGTFSLSLYPQFEAQVRTLNKDEQRQFWAELHLASQLLQIMENTWIVLQLEKNYEHPVHRGWKKVFELWAGSRIIRQHWDTLSKEFSESFVKFCERELGELLHDA